MLLNHSCQNVYDLPAQLLLLLHNPLYVLLSNNDLPVFLQFHLLGYLHGQVLVASAEFLDLETVGSEDQVSVFETDVAGLDEFADVVAHVIVSLAFKADKGHENVELSLLQHQLSSRILLIPGTL